MSTSLEEKMQEFSAAVLAEAQAKRAELEAENEKIKTKKIDSVQNEFLSDAYSKIQSCIADIKKSENERVLNAQNLLKRELLMKRESIIDDVFKKAVDKIKKFMDTDAYAEWLNKKLQQAMDAVGDGSKTVYVRNDDMQIIGKCISEMSIDNADVKSVSDNDFIGGLMVENTDSNILVDFSFKELIGVVKSGFLQKSGLTID